MPVTTSRVLAPQTLPMPNAAQTEALRQLLATRTPLVVVQTHEETRLLGLVEAISKADSREVWAWSAARGLRVAHGLKLTTKEKNSLKNNFLINSSVALPVFFPFLRIQKKYS